ncbi:type II toxin-antitoxin system VapC family toxin [bacterium]|nr:type II toxin-antitoxin system VapC family toxin [bacterium]
MGQETERSNDAELEGVLDAGAVLAAIRDEPGGDYAERVIPQSVILSVNLSEVATVLVRNGMPFPVASQVLTSLGMQVVPFDAELALRAASLFPIGKPLGLSLGDRACLALALHRGSPVFTTERRWAELQLPIKVEVIR